MRKKTKKGFSLHEKTGKISTIKVKVKIVFYVFSFCIKSYNTVIYSITTNSTVKATTLEVSIEDTALLSDIKRAISMIRGVGRVAVVL